MVHTWLATRSIVVVVVVATVGKQGLIMSCRITRITPKFNAIQLVVTLDVRNWVHGELLHEPYRLGS